MSSEDDELCLRSNAWRSGRRKYIVIDNSSESDDDGVNHASFAYTQKTMQRMDNADGLAVALQSSHLQDETLHTVSSPGGDLGHEMLPHTVNDTERQGALADEDTFKHGHDGGAGSDMETKGMHPDEFYAATSETIGFQGEASHLSLPPSPPTMVTAGSSGASPAITQSCITAASHGETYWSSPSASTAMEQHVASSQHRHSSGQHTSVSSPPASTPLAMASSPPLASHGPNVPPNPCLWTPRDQVAVQDSPMSSFATPASSFVDSPSQREHSVEEEGTSAFTEAMGHEPEGASLEGLSEGVKLLQLAPRDAGVTGITDIDTSFSPGLAADSVMFTAMGASSQQASPCSSLLQEQTCSTGQPRSSQGECHNINELAQKLNSCQVASTHRRTMNSATGSPQQGGHTAISAKADSSCTPSAFATAASVSACAPSCGADAPGGLGSIVAMSYLGDSVPIPASRNLQPHGVRTITGTDMHNAAPSEAAQAEQEQRVCSSRPEAATNSPHRERRPSSFALQLGGSSGSPDLQPGGTQHTQAVMGARGGVSSESEGGDQGPRAMARSVRKVRGRRVVLSDSDDSSDDEPVRHQQTGVCVAGGSLFPAHRPAQTPTQAHVATPRLPSISPSRRQLMLPGMGLEAPQTPALKQQLAPAAPTPAPAPPPAGFDLDWGVTPARPRQTVQAQDAGQAPWSCFKPIARSRKPVLEQPGPGGGGGQAERPGPHDKRRGSSTRDGGDGRPKSRKAKPAAIVISSEDSEEAEERGGGGDGSSIDLDTSDGSAVIKSEDDAFAISDSDDSSRGSGGVFNPQLHSSTSDDSGNDDSDASTKGFLPTTKCVGAPFLSTL